MNNYKDPPPSHFLNSLHFKTSKSHTTSRERKEANRYSCTIKTKIYIRIHHRKINNEPTCNRFPLSTIPFFWVNSNQILNGLINHQSARRVWLSLVHVAWLIYPSLETNFPHVLQIRVKNWKKWTRKEWKCSVWILGTDKARYVWIGVWYIIYSTVSFIGSKARVIWWSQSGLGCDI